MKKKFMVEIEVDEKNIEKKYPNYNINFSSPNNFIAHLVEDFIYDADINMSVNGLKKWGYSKKIKEIK